MLNGRIISEKLTGGTIEGSGEQRTAEDMGGSGGNLTELLSRHSPRGTEEFDGNPKSE
jgi:hypothetical protein